MRVSPAVFAQRRVLRQRIRSVGGAFLLVAGVLVTLAALLRSSPSSAVHTGGRQLSASPSGHTSVHLHIHKLHKAAAAVTNTTTSDATNATTASTNVTAEQESSCGVEASWEQNGGIFVYVALLLYIFVALAIVCDDYFVTALEKITEKLKLSQDVAGATFMAAGSSAPELFVALADNVFTKPEASLGIGTIVGSAIFNILIIISLSALLAGQVLMLDWRPLLRDSLWYTWAILVLTYAIWDGSVDIFESVLLFGSYIAYCIYMSQNERVIGACCRRPEDDEELIEKELQEAKNDAVADRAAQLVDAHVPTDETGAKRAWTVDVERVESSDVAVHLSRQSSTGSSQPHHSHPHRLGSQSRLNPMFQSKYRMFQHHHSSTISRDSASETKEELPVKHVVGGTLRPLQDPTITNVSEAAALASQQSTISIDSKGDEATEDLGGYFDELFDVPVGILPKLWFFFTRPIVIAMRLTIPDCRYPIFSGALGFTATFFIAIVWIAFLSHYTVVFATRFGCIAGIPSALMGLTIIAAGTSIPDALSSILVARAGHGDMAVSNALGSNVFDILLGLGLPFFLSNLIYKEPVVIVTDDLELSIFILFGVLVAVVGLLILSKWRLRKTSGGIMIVLYGVYVVVSYVRGM